MSSNPTICRKIKTRALICRNGHFICIKKVTGSHTHFTLPGGTVEGTEQLELAVKRECREEIDAEIRLVRLLGVFEHSISYVFEPNLQKHKLEFVFLAEVDDSYTPRIGPNPDPEQVQVFWMPFKQAASRNFIPPQLPDALGLGLQQQLGYWTSYESKQAAARIR